MRCDYGISSRQSIFQKKKNIVLERHGEKIKEDGAKEGGISELVNSHKDTGLRCEYDREIK